MFYRGILAALVVSLSLQSMDITHEMLADIKKDFASIEELSLGLLSLCPKEQCVVIGIGQSPTPFLAYLETLYNHFFFCIRLSDFRYCVCQRALDVDVLIWLYEHFALFFPKQS